MDLRRRIFLLASCSMIVTVLAPASAGVRDGSGGPPRFSDAERRIIEQYYGRGNQSKSKSLPPGLAKRGGNLPPGLQKQLARNGQLPPGLQKRVEPLPLELNRQLPPLPEYWERVIVERDVILLDRRTNRILDIIEGVIALATGK
jgi:hypothetical protein